MHNFVYMLMGEICPEEQVKKELWEDVLIDELRQAYKRAMDHARFLLIIERAGKPITYNHYFNENLQRSRSSRLSEALDRAALPYINNGRGGRTICLDDIRNISTNKSNPRQVHEDLHDILESYYKVSRKRFVDVVCQQVVDHLLLSGETSPLRIFSPERVMMMDEDQMEMIAGEDAGTKTQRVLLTREIESLEAAMKVLRG